MEFPITVECYVGANHTTAQEECCGPLEYNAYAAWLENRTAEGSFEEFARDRFIIGDKESVKEEIAHYRELPGVDHFIMAANGRPAAETRTGLDPAPRRDLRLREPAVITCQL